MNWHDAIVGVKATIKDAVVVIDNSSLQIVLVVYGNGRLFGTVTDGDVRRGLLRGLSMDAPVTEIMNANPVTAAPDAAPGKLLKKMTEAMLRQIPLVDEGGRVVGLVHMRELTPSIESRDNWVVLMAGGLGERLRPLTEETPKPMLSVGDKPLLETILESFVEQKFRRFYISVNYMADAIKRHFGDGRRWNVDIRYLEEDRRLGTAGALRLMPEMPRGPVLIMNGDLIARINFQDLLDYHVQQKSKATMCVRQYDLQVPFGVVGIDGNVLKSIDEKPVHRFFVNAGIYVLDPRVISLVPQDWPCDMTELFATVIASGEDTVVFPIHEYWLDVARRKDLDRANSDIARALKSAKRL